jgi:hypothetical protein
MAQKIQMLGLVIYHVQIFLKDPMEQHKPAHLAIANSLARGYYNKYHMYRKYCLEERITPVDMETWEYHEKNPPPIM